MSVKTNNEWLSAVKDTRNYNENYTKRKKKTSVGKCTGTLLKPIEFLELPPYKNLHQTRVSSYFKKNSKKKINSVKENKKLHPDYKTCSKSNSVPIIIVEETKENRTENKKIPLCNKLNSVTEITESQKLEDDALFGVCGDSLYEISGDIEYVISGEHEKSFNDDNASDCCENNSSVDRKELNNELSPCMVSKYRKTNHSLNQSNKCHIKVNTNDSYTHVNKLTFRKHLPYDKYENKCLTSSNYIRNKNKCGCKYKATECVCEKENNIPINVDEEFIGSPLTSIIPPSPIIFSGSFEHSTNKDDTFVQKYTDQAHCYCSPHSKANAEHSDTFFLLPSWPFTEENTCETDLQDKGAFTGNINDKLTCSSLSGDSFRSCYNPPSPIHFTEN